MQNLSYDIILGMDWIKSTNPAIDWVNSSLELTVGANHHILLALPVNSITNLTLSSAKQVLAEVKYVCPAWFGLLHPHSLLDTKGVLTTLEGGDSAKVLGTDPSLWEQVCSEFSNVLEQPGSPLERAIKHEVDLLPCSKPPAKR